tara:strand:- start:370 stop:978 length:609 start_codon:yes stop_codon:yes gene_type:complete
MDFHEVYDSIYSQGLQNEPRKFIEIFTHNRILIERQSILNDTLISDKIIRLKSDYAISLAQTESCKKALPEIEQALSLIKERPQRKNSKLLGNEDYAELLFARGVVHFRGKQYKKSIQDLGLLAIEFPENDKYTSWLKNANAYKLYRIERAFYFTIVATLFIYLLFDGIHYLFDRFLIVLFAACLISIVVLEIIKWRRTKTG